MTVYVYGYKKNLYSDDELKEKPILNLLYDLIESLEDVEFDCDDKDNRHTVECSFPRSRYPYGKFTEKDNNIISQNIVMGWTVVFKVVNSDDVHFLETIKVLNKYDEFKMIMEANVDESKTGLRY